MCIRPRPPDAVVWGRAQGSAFFAKAPDDYGADVRDGSLRNPSLVLPLQGMQRTILEQ